jgi:hypothetical protein
MLNACTGPLCTALHRTALHCTALHCTAPLGPDVPGRPAEGAAGRPQSKAVVVLARQHHVPAARQAVMGEAHWVWAGKL